VIKNRRRLAAVEEPQVNLTPLIDVVFVILIMFIVIVPLLEVDRIQLAEGIREELESVHSSAQNISLHVYEDNSLKVNGDVIAINDLATYLSLAKQRNPKSHLHLFHDENAKFGIYQKVKNAAQTAGFRDMDLILKPK